MRYFNVGFRKTSTQPTGSSLSPDQWPTLSERLRAIQGIEEVVLFVEEQVAYLKIDKQKLNQPALDALQNSLL